MEDVFSYLAAALIVVDVLFCLFCAEHTDVHSSLVGLLQSLNLGNGTAHGNILRLLSHRCLAGGQFTYYGSSDWTA